MITNDEDDEDELQFPISAHQLKSSLPVIEWALSSGTVEQLESIVRSHGRNSLGQKDPRGDTPLMVAFGYYKFDQCEMLLRLNAPTGTSNKFGISFFSEIAFLPARSTILEREKLLKYISHSQNEENYLCSRSLIACMRLLIQAADFYFSISVEYDCLIRLLADVPDNSTFKIYKKGNKLRIDYSTNLIVIYKLISVNEVEKFTTNTIQRTVQKTTFTLERTEFDAAQPLEHFNFVNEQSVVHLNLDEIMLKDVKKGYFNPNPKREMYEGTLCEYKELLNIQVKQTLAKPRKYIRTNSDYMDKSDYCRGLRHFGCSATEQSAKKVTITGLFVPENYPFSVSKKSLTAVLEIVDSKELNFVGSVLKRLSYEGVPVNLKWSKSINSKCIFSVGNFSAIQEEVRGVSRHGGKVRFATNVFHPNHI